VLGSVPNSVYRMSHRKGLNVQGCFNRDLTVASSAVAPTALLVHHAMMPHDLAVHCCTEKLCETACYQHTLHSRFGPVVSHQWCVWLLRVALLVAEQLKNDAASWRDSGHKQVQAGASRWSTAGRQTRQQSRAEAKAAASGIEAM